MAKQTMDNIAHTGSIDFGSSSMYGDVERKGGSVMSNRPYTSDMSGAFQTIIGAGTLSPEELDRMKKESAKKADVKDAKHAAAAVKIDTRISKLLKPEYASAYASAATTKSKPKYLDNTLVVLFGLASDEGVGGMVVNVADASSVFGSLAMFQRAMVRRLKERSTFMNRGWLGRMLQGEKRVDDFTQEEFKKFLDKLGDKDRKGGIELSNKDKASTLSSSIPVAPQVDVSAPSASIPAANAPIALVSSPMQTTQGMRLGSNPMGNAAVTGADLAMGYQSYTGMHDPMVNAPVTGADLAMGYQAYTGAGVFRRDSGRVVNVGGYQAYTGAQHSEAAAAIDERIASCLKPYWSALYRVATLGNMMERKCAANSLMVAMLSDEGLASMVKSTSDCEVQFQNLGLMQRAMARRIKECCTWGGHSAGAQLITSGDVMTGAPYLRGVPTPGRGPVDRRRHGQYGPRHAYMPSSQPSGSQSQQGQGDSGMPASEHSDEAADWSHDLSGAQIVTAGLGADVIVRGTCGCTGGCLCNKSSTGRRR